MRFILLTAQISSSQEMLLAVPDDFDFHSHRQTLEDYAEGFDLDEDVEITVEEEKPGPYQGEVGGVWREESVQPFDYWDQDRPRGAPGKSYHDLRSERVEWALAKARAILEPEDPDEPPPDHPGQNVMFAGVELRR